MTTALLAPATRPAKAPIALRPAQQLTQTPRTGSWKRAAGLACRWTVRSLVALAALAFAVLAVGPHVLDYRTMTMLTGSMSPDISQALVYGAPTLLAGWLLLTIWRPTTPTTGIRTDEEDQA